MKILNLFKKYNWKTAKPTLKPNYYLIPVVAYKPNEDNIKIFNDIYETIKSEEINKIVRTKSGGICYKRKYFRLPAYDCNTKIDKRTQELKEVEITLLTGEGFVRIQLTNRQVKDGSGSANFKKFIHILSRFGIDINSYAITKEEGLQAKSEIKKDLIKLSRPQYAGITFENVHHLDYNSSFPAGLVNTHKEFKEAIEYLFNKRHENKSYKAILNYSIGMMQSEYISYRFAHLARDAKNDNHKRLSEMAEKLKANGNTVISYNTDGIWYQGDIYHDADEGTELGQWKNDHTDCIFRAKSDGAYEYMEDGKCYPVVRGQTKLDHIKPREEWNWGDIFNEDARIIHYRWDEEKGVVVNEEIN